MKKTIMLLFVLFAAVSCRQVVVYPHDNGRHEGHWKHDRGCEDCGEHKGKHHGKGNAYGHKKHKKHD